MRAHPQPPSQPQQSGRWPRWNSLCRPLVGAGSAPLWERALPAMKPAHSPPHPKCAPPIQTPSRAEPAPTMACNTAIQGITHDPLVGAGSAREEARTFTAPSEMYAAHPDAFAGRDRSHNGLRHYDPRHHPRSPCGSGLCPRRGPHIHRPIRNVHRPSRRLRGQSPLPQWPATSPQRGSHRCYTAFFNLPSAFPPNLHRK